MSKYKNLYQEMFDSNKEKFTAFLEVHDLYLNNKSENKEKFDTIGKDVLYIINQYEQKLCGRMERGTKGVFSSKVSEKFWEVIRKDFPLVDEVGVKKSFVKV